MKRMKEQEARDAILSHMGCFTDKEMNGINLSCSDMRFEEAE